MGTSSQKPSGIAYVTPKDVGRTDATTQASASPEFWTTERISSTELDSIQCLRTAVEVVALSEAPPFAAYAAVLGGHQCVVNLFGDFFASEKDNAALHQVSNLFDPLGLPLGVVGGLLGLQGLVVGSELGGLLNDLLDLGTLNGTSLETFGLIKTKEDFATFLEDANKLKAEFEQRFGSGANDKSDQEEDNTVDQSPETPPDPPPSPADNDDSDDDGGDFEPPHPEPNGDDDFFMG